MSLFFTPPTPTHAAHAHTALMPPWLLHLGAFGLFFVAIVDASPIPLPLPGSTDLLLLILVAHSGSTPWLLTICAISGSILGGYTTWHLGRKGGEAAMKRYVPARLHARVVKWVQGHHILAVFLPAVLPPPIPLLPFALASGALGVTRTRFLVVFSIARAIRYSFVAWLGVIYGRKVVRMFSADLQKWSTPLLCSFGVMFTASLIYATWKVRQSRRSEKSASRGLNTQTT